MDYTEVNFDGLPGPTYNYAGLAFGNMASMASAKTISNPKIAALQGLEKMRLLSELGVPQAVLPPHPRPNLELLSRLKFSGSVADILMNASKVDPQLLAASYSASSMWVANAATVSPALNTDDNKIHLTPANLIMNLHRAQEADINYKILQQIFCDDNYFVVHKPLDSIVRADEGAANHSFICEDYNQEGLELFVYGKSGLAKSNKLVQSKFPERQTLEASTAIIKLHNIKTSNFVLLQQSPEAITAGAFHNDVVCVGNKNVLMYHEDAFIKFDAVKREIIKKFGANFYFIEIRNSELSLEQAVLTYIFNSQIVSLANNSMAIIAPKEVEESINASKVIARILSEHNPIKAVKYVNCRESMKNGGGPACLRLRVIMPKDALSSLGGNIIFTPRLYLQLKNWIEKHYRDKLAPEDLVDSELYDSSMIALKDLENILQLRLF